MAGSANRGSPPRSLWTGLIRPPLVLHHWALGPPPRCWCPGFPPPPLVISDWTLATCPSGETSPGDQPSPVCGPLNSDVSTSTLVGLVPPSAFLTWVASSSSRAAPGYSPFAPTDSVGSPP